MDGGVWPMGRNKYCPANWHSRLEWSTIQKWVDSSEASPFSQHPPNSQLCSIQNLLVQDNAHHAKGNVQALLSQRDCSDNPPGSTEVTSENREHHTHWSVGPEQAWLQAPIASRPSVEENSWIAPHCQRGTRVMRVLTTSTAWIPGPAHSLLDI